jgi:hypothetical protein
MLQTIIETLFPRHTAKPKADFTNVSETEIVEVTLEEIIHAVKKVGLNKAPGPDAIQNRALKSAINNNTILFVRVMQACLQEGIFPKKWKRQKLVLLPKPGKPPGEPSSYCPICLFDTIGKILERIIQNRLLPITEGEGGLSCQQFGFRKSRSTVEAIKMVMSIAKKALQGKQWKGGSKQYCAVITLDIKNAFNTANWCNIMSALQNMNVPRYLLKILHSYFEDRVLQYESEEGSKEYKITAGVPQGSVLG